MMEVQQRTIAAPEPATSDPLQTEPVSMPPPPSPTRTPAVTSSISKRHTKGLSLNLPVLLPSAAQSSQSPISRSSIHSPTESIQSSPRSRTAPGAPFRSPDLSAAPPERSRPRGSADFLTLLAAQERKVLELKEELLRAETDLGNLKKQWAMHEASKKRDEVRQVKRLQPLALDEVSTVGITATEEGQDEERRRKRELIERGHTNNAASATSETPGLGRRGSKRVFQGGHTRALSLLSPTSTKSIARGDDERRASQDSAPESGDDGRPSLSRMPTLDGLMSGEALPLAFGKTYKDLAAHRRSLPPVAADMLVKQGKQVYDGVKDGLWTFFEDIRQATVGEEGINGTATQQRPPRTRRPSRRPGDQLRKDSTKEHDRATKEPSFWKEFGLDTPQKSDNHAKALASLNGHVQQKGSTDSSNPPSLLVDLNDDGDDSWDAWESPASNKSSKALDQAIAPGDGLPWPEMPRATPSTKLTRTISDLMHEWNSSQTSLANDIASSPGQTHILDSPHI